MLTLLLQVAVLLLLQPMPTWTLPTMLPMIPTRPTLKLVLLSAFAHSAAAQTPQRLPPKRYQRGAADLA